MWIKHLLFQCLHQSVDDELWPTRPALKIAYELSLSVLPLFKLRKALPRKNFPTDRDISLRSHLKLWIIFILYQINRLSTVRQRMC